MSQNEQNGTPPRGGQPRPAASGQLRERPFARLLHQLMRKRVTGWLVVVVEGGEKSGDKGDESRVFLREGAPVHVVRPTDADRLDHVIAEAGLIPPEVLHAVAAELPPGKRLGEVLVERGLVAETTLADLLKVQMRRKLFKLFHAEAGSYAIYVDAHRFGTGEEFREMRVDPRCLVFEGIRAAYDEARLRRELGPLVGRRFRLLRAVPASLLEAMGFPKGDATVALLDGGARTFSDLPPRGVAAKDAFAVVLALLYTDLLEAEVAAAPAGKAAPATGPVRAPAAVTMAPAASSGSLPVVKAPAKPAGGAIDEAGLRARIEELLGRADALSHFELVGVPESASIDEISAAYLRRMREFHPDRIAGRGLRDLATRAAALVARINEAHAVLLDPKRKAAYLAERAGSPPPADLARAIIHAEESFRKGEVLLRRHDFAGAEEAFAAAVNENPSEPIYKAYALWARWQNPAAPKDRLVRETLVGLIAVGAELPKFALGRYWQGLLYKHLGDLVAAESAFRSAIAEDKNLLDAERELRVLEMRRTKAATAAPPDKAAAVSAARPKSSLDKLLKR
jgi:tetratricopeptide (TPR) repeat protein